jgi:uncharacterized protein
MKSSETDILLIPGFEPITPNHWQSRIVAKLSTARFVDVAYPSLTDSVGAIAAAVSDAKRPVLFIAHSAGAALVAHAMPSLVQIGRADSVRGAYLVAPTSGRAVTEIAALDPAFADLPREPLPFPSVLVASHTDPHSTLEEAADLALAWGAQMVEAGDAGHINEASGHGPWPEGIMRLAGFMSKL